MKLSKILRVIVKDPSGGSVWKETSQLYLPKGGKKLSFKQNALIFIGLGICVYTYAQFQADFNPDSWWGKKYRQLSSDPFGFMLESKKEE
uniref:DUF5683 domain-containing protein n=1 Tax=Steinernema glaseri TaxID=37863 RepID=A0A1I7ZL24_9BILA